MSVGSAILRQIESGDKDESLVHQLLAEFNRSYPVTELQKLFLSKDVSIVKNAAWIASELGEKGKPILSATADLLSHSSKYVRFFAIDSILTCATAEDAVIIAKAVSLLADPEQSVRWKAMDFLMRATQVQLRAAGSHSSVTNFHNFFTWIAVLVEDENPDTERIVSFLKSDDPVERRFGAAAAARALKRTATPFKYALTCEDKEIRQFAESVCQSAKPKRI